MESNFIMPDSTLIREVVHSFWQVSRHNSPPISETIVPKGVVEIIFSFDTNPFNARVNDKVVAVPRCFIQGYRTSPIYLQVPASQTFFGVVVYPSAVKHLCNYYPMEFTNQLIDLTLVDTSFYSLWHCLGEQRSFNTRVRFFTQWLIERLPELNSREKAFNEFLSVGSNLNLSVTELANQFCYSTKQLSRKIHELTGMNAEQVLLYKKYLQAIHLMHSSSLLLSEVAYSCQFSDQSHFIKVFKSLSKLTPKEYRQRKSAIEGHIFENVL